MKMIHLIGQQALPNVLPILAYKPTHVVHILSKDPRKTGNFRDVIAQIEDAVREAGLVVAFETIELSEMPTISETQAAIEGLCAGEREIVNLTGGTKLMSIGAYNAAIAKQAGILYCDTKARKFLNLVSGSEDQERFTDVAKLLSVRVLMAANGSTPGQWTHSEIREEHLAFGRIAWELRTKYERDFRDWNSTIFRWISTLERNRDQFSLLRACREQRIGSVIPLNSTTRAYLRAAENIGIVEKSRDGQDWHLSLTDENPHEQLSEKANLLVGTWLELAVIAMIHDRSQRFINPLWSVRPIGEAIQHGETDIVCINAKSSALTLISCKNSLNAGSLEHIEALRHRADKMGGSHADACLVIHYATNSDNRQLLMERAKEHNVKIWIGSDILNLL